MPTPKKVKPKQRKPEPRVKRRKNSMPRKLNVEAPIEEVRLFVDESLKVAELTEPFSNGELNTLREKLNEVIRKIN